VHLRVQAHRRQHPMCGPRVGVPFRRVAPPIHWESVEGSPPRVEDHHPRAGGSFGWSLGGPRCVPCGTSPGAFLLRTFASSSALGVLCACLGVPRVPPGTAVAVWRVCVRRYRARVMGPPETRERVCVWCAPEAIVPRPGATHKIVTETVTGVQISLLY
jgi:hypothetical protein